MFRSATKTRIFIAKREFKGPVYNCRAVEASLRNHFRPFSFHDCYLVNFTLQNFQAKSDDCTPIIDPLTHFTLNNSLRTFKYNAFRDKTYVNESSSNWFCKHEDKRNEKGIRTRIETWLSVLSDENENLIVEDADDLEPFQSYESPHIDIRIGYFSNRKRFETIEYQIFKASKLLHEGVMINGHIYSDISVDEMYDWSGTLTIVIGKEIWMSTENKIMSVKFAIQTQLYKSKIHGMVRVWGRLPSDPNNDCKTRIEQGLGLICHYYNGIPNGKCWRGLIGGAWLYGEMAKDGEFSGKEIAYINQDMSIGYKGIFRRGVMMNASVVDITGEYCNKQGIKVLEFSDSTSYLGITFRYKRPNSDSMGDQPLIVDPLDNKYIDLGQSSIDTGEFSQTFKENGAFAKEYIPPQTIISHYNGYIVNRKEIHEWINKQIRKLRIDQKSNKYSMDLKDKLIYTDVDRFSSYK